MADNVVLDPGSGGATLATDDIGSVHYQRIKLVYGADGSANDVQGTMPLPVTPGVDSPQVTSASSVALVAGSSADLDSTQINSGKTGKLTAVTICSSVALKGELKTVLNASETSIGVIFSRAGEPFTWVMPSKDYVTQAESATAGFDGFRMTVTNLDTSATVDAYVTFFYDEV